MEEELSMQRTAYPIVSTLLSSTPSRRDLLKCALGLSIAGTALGSTGYAQAQSDAGAWPEARALHLYWSDTRGDYFTTATQEGDADADTAGYSYVGIDGYVSDQPLEGLVPLNLYWSQEREDNFLAATPEAVRDMGGLNYRLIRTEGYISDKPRAGLVPLKLYWSDAKKDNLLVASPETEQLATDEQYTFVRNEGWVIPPVWVQKGDDREYLAGGRGLKLYWSGNSEDNLTTSTQEGEDHARFANYSFIRIEGYAFNTQENDPLHATMTQFWSTDRGDFFLTATADGRKDAVDASYEEMWDEYAVLTEPAAGLVPLNVYWSGDRADNFTAATKEGERAALDNGYRLVRTEGYVLPGFSERPTT